MLEMIMLLDHPDRWEWRTIMGEPSNNTEKFGMAIGLATAQMRLLDAPTRASEIGVEWDGKAFLFRYFGCAARVVQSTGECTLDGRHCPSVDMVLILHYIIGARTFDLDNRWISYRELPDGSPYLQAFLERGPRMIATSFDGDTDWFVEAVTRLGGTRAPDLPGLAFIVPALPRLPLAVLFHEGEPGLPADANILFDASAPLHFCPEDLAVLGERLAHRLVRNA